MSDANTPPPAQSAPSAPARPDVEMVFNALFGSADLAPKENQ
ncbi:hypothetical protein AAIB33_10620 [Microbacterium sp. AZCO]